MFILVFLIIIIIISTLSLAFIFSEVKVDIKDLKILNKDNKITNLNFEKVKINVGLYLFKKIRIVKIKINDKELKVFNFKIPLKKINEINKNSLYSVIKNLKENYRRLNIKNIKPEFEKFKLNLKLGTENAIVTSFTVFSVSNIITFILQSTINKYNNKKYNYKIEPIYINKNYIFLDYEGIVKFKTRYLIMFFKKYYNLVKKESLEKSRLEIVKKQEIKAIKRYI